MPSKKQLMVGLVIVAVGLLIYNKVPAVKSALGGA